MNKSQHSRPDASAATSASEGSRSRLDSWKEVASYLGRSEKTVRRWEQSEGLPVHRLLHEKRGSVYGYTDELDAWREGRRAAIKSEAALTNGEAKPDSAKNPAARVASPRTVGVTGRLRRRWRAALLTLAILLLIASLAAIHWGRLRDGIAGGQSAVRIQSLAVLPFKNLSSDTEHEYFAEGMTEQLITELASISSKRVISRTSIMHYKNTGKSLPEIARELNVDAMVEGTIMRSGSRVRMTVQLVSPSPEQHLWAETYEGDIRNVLDLQRNVARDIGRKIQTKLAAGPAAGSGTKKQMDPETYEDYLRGRYFLARRNAEAMTKALAYFHEAVRRDPQYGEAYAGLAITYDLLGSYELLPPVKSFPKADEFAGKALHLNDRLSEAYTARAFAVSFWKFNWSAAERDFKRAIALDPSSALAHQWYGEHLINVGKAERAVAELKRARELDPLSLVINSTLGRVYRDAHRYEEAVQQCRKTLELDPHFSLGHWCLGQAFVGERRYAAAVSELELANSLGTTPLLFRDLGWVYATLGNKARAKEILATLSLKRESGYVSPYSIAAICSALGKKDEAFKWLERAYNERDSHITYLTLDPEMEPLRSDRRFPSVLQRLNIPP